MRKALIVGIDYYDALSPLRGCVNDAVAMARVLERHEDCSVNFATPRLMISQAATGLIRTSDLRAAVQDLFSDRSEIALFYFGGHGHLNVTGGNLCGGDSRSGDDGLSLRDVMTYASASRAENKVIILDSCHSGAAGDRPGETEIAEIGRGMTLLTASTSDQRAREDQASGSGVFTDLLVDALEGAAANLVGDVTPGSVYAHIDQSLGPWDGQRPVFKTNVQQFVSLRKAKPPIPLQDLQALARFFPRPDYRFPLDPAYEPERPQEPVTDTPPPDRAKTEVFAALQRLAKVNLVRPVDAPHMWHAAMSSKSCELTVLGQHYRRLAEGSLL
jgi:Caspase domain